MSGFEPTDDQKTLAFPLDAGGPPVATIDGLFEGTGTINRPILARRLLGCSGRELE